MKWRGETHDQWLERTRKPHQFFALLPRQTVTGEWVWLDKVWRCRHIVPFGWDLWVYGTQAEHTLPYRPRTPPPPKPKP